VNDGASITFWRGLAVGVAADADDHCLAAA
jgi:hypothetical protein